MGAAGACGMNARATATAAGAPRANARRNRNGLRIMGEAPGVIQGGPLAPRADSSVASSCPATRCAIRSRSERATLLLHERVGQRDVVPVERGFRLNDDLQLFDALDRQYQPLRLVLAGQRPA